MDNKYFGKYRGKVTDNRDPEQCGRVKLIVPSLLQGEEVWAMPCVAYAGPEVGLVLIPPIGASVWVEFEEGILDSPIYSGCYWNKGELPTEARDNPAEIKLLKTAGIRLIWNDKKNAGGMTLEVVTPAVSTPLKITMDQAGLTLNFNKEQATIKMNSNGIAILNQGQSIQITQGKVAINGNHLEVI